MDPRAPSTYPPKHGAYQKPQGAKADPYYGNEMVAKTCANFITHLFACPELPPTTATVSSATQAKLPAFIAYALHRTKLHPAVTYSALVLLQRLKARFPTARGSSGHRLFLSAYMISSKVICDDTYSNKSWGIVGQGMFNLREINQMEREMCGYLEWELNVDPDILKTFTSMVARDFMGKGPYPAYLAEHVSKRKLGVPAATAAIAPIKTTTSPIPMFTNEGKPGDASAAAAAAAGVPLQTKVGKRKPAYPTPPVSPGDTPPTSYSNSTSPASSASPATPVGSHDPNARVAGEDLRQSRRAQRKAREETQNSHHLKIKMYAYAVPSQW